MATKAILGLGNACLKDVTTLDELSAGIKHLKLGKNLGIDGILADMIIDGSDRQKSACFGSSTVLLPANRFPEHLSIGLISAVQFGGKSDMSNYRDTTASYVIGRLFAKVLEPKIASWAEKQGVQAKGQAGFRKDFCAI